MAEPEKLYDAVRIAIGETVYTTDCNVSLKDDGFLWLACRDSNGVHISGKFNLNLMDAVQEVKYFLLVDEDEDDKEDGVINVDDDDGAAAHSHHHNLLEQQDNDHLSFLFLKVSASCAGNYRPDTSDYRLPVRTYYTILIEFRTDSDIKEILKVFLVGLVDSSKMTTKSNDGTAAAAKLNATQAQTYGRVFLQHSQEELKLRLAAIQKQGNRQSAAVSHNNNKFLQDKGENDILLVYPIAGGDPAAIDAAADGLNEVRGPETVSAGVHVAAAVAAAASTSSSEPGASNGCIVAAEAESGPTVPNKTGRTHNVTIQVGDYLRLEPKEYLNDSLIDFWMRWILRRHDHGDNTNNSSNLMHIFSTHFYTSLVDNGAHGVTNWTAKKNINIFEKKLLIIPINKTLHWSMVAVVNPRHIVAMEKPENAGAGRSDDPASFILFFDSHKAHQIASIARRIRAWLNSEWKRLQLNLEFKRDAPFSPKTLVVYNPTSTCTVEEATQTSGGLCSFVLSSHVNLDCYSECLPFSSFSVPYQRNGWDCGVFICRYAYGLYLLRREPFSFGQTDLRSSKRKDRFRLLITENDAFKFNGDDIQRIRTEIKTLIENLSIVYASVKKSDREAKETAAAISLQATKDTMTTTTEEKTEEFRVLFEQAILDIAATAKTTTNDDDDDDDPDVGRRKRTRRRLCLILSGGVDTCAILAAARHVGVAFEAAFTFCCSGGETITCPDRDFAVAAAQQHNIKQHYVIEISPMQLVEQHLRDCIQTLHCYDGMTLRNSLVVAAAFQKAAKLGFTDAVVGDAADELFGGYSFMWGNENDSVFWKEKRDSMCRQWTFATTALAKFHHMTSHSPYMAPAVVEWALQNVERRYCIGIRPIQLTYNSEKIPHLTGKLLLRQAYDTVASWRRKDPIEVGSGVTVIGQDDFWKLQLPDAEFQAEEKELKSRGFVITSKENVVNFRIFEQIFGGANGVWNLPTSRRLPIGQGCIGCCFDLIVTTENKFCHICGAYPAQRTSANNPVPEAT
jgi:asparagine synthase (glutamine-hydrolysing)